MLSKLKPFLDKSDFQYEFVLPTAIGKKISVVYNTHKYTQVLRVVTS